MDYLFETHWEMLVLTPMQAVTHGDCTDPNCEADHWRLSASFIFWTVEVFW
jgi:hypothetical protein